MSTTNYSTLFLKLQKKLPTKETYEKPNLNRKITPTASQKNLLMYEGFKEYNNALKFPKFDDCNEFVNKWATKQQDFRLTHGFDLASGKLIFLKLHVLVLEINSHHSLNTSMLYMISLQSTSFSCVHVNIWFSWKFLKINPRDVQDLTNWKAK